MVRVLAEVGMREDTFFFHAADGFSYHFNRVMKGGRLSLRCIYYSKRRCRARASVDSNGRNFRNGLKHRHNHREDRNLIHARRFRSSVLNQCRLTENATVNLKAIYHRVRRQLRLPRFALSNLSYKKLRTSMLRARAETLPPIPHSLSALGNVLNDQTYEFLTTSLDKEDNIFLGKFGQTNLRTRVIIFASSRALEMLSQCTTVMSDATFSTVPAALRDNCAQVWPIIALRRHHIIPLVRVLMHSKTQACYETALRAIRQAAVNFNPEAVMCDFESAQSNAWKAIAGKAKELGLARLIRDNEQVDSIVRSLCALALLSWDLILDGLQYIAQRCVAEGYWDILSPLLRYVRRSWCSPSKLRLLSVYKCPDRTSNACESANAMLKASVQSDHPNVWTFINAINNAEDEAKFDWDTLDEGFNPSRARRASALANDESIKGF